MLFVVHALDGDLSLKIDCDLRQAIPHEKQAHTLCCKKIYHALLNLRCPWSMWLLKARSERWFILQCTVWCFVCHVLWRCALEMTQFIVWQWSEDFNGLINVGDLSMRITSYKSGDNDQCCTHHNQIYCICEYVSHTMSHLSGLVVGQTLRRTEIRWLRWWRWEYSIAV